MKRYLRIYKLLLSINLSDLMAYRAGFFGSFFGTTIWGVFHFISIFILTSRVNSVYGWSRSELFMLTATFSIMWGTFRMIFIKNFSQFSHTILQGKLDGLLLKPLDSQFLMSVLKVNYVDVGRIVMGSVFMIYVIHTYHITITLWSIMLFSFLIIFSMFSAYALWFSVSTIIIWFPRLSNLIELLYTFAGILRYPSDLMGGFGEFTVFFLAPILFILTTPVKTLIGRMSIPDIAWLIIFSLLFLLFSRLFWKHALKSYTSVSS